MRDLRVFVAGLVLAALIGGRAVAQAAPAGEPPASSSSTTKNVRLPITQIALYKNGVGFFELSGKVTGNTLVQIDLTTDQLNEALQSLTAVDSGGGHIVGLGYDSTLPLAEQLRQLNLGLGPDPTVVEFLQAIKGKRVEVRAAGGVVTGKVLNVEVHPYTNPKTGESGEHRVVTVVTDGGSLRSVELTPSVEVRLVSATEKTEIGKYLEILATSHEDGVRHLILEDQGTGERELHISYLATIPGWTSSYRILLTNGGKTATLQGWAAIHNTTAHDWENVQLTLVSGVPQAFARQIPRANRGMGNGGWVNVTAGQSGLDPMAGGAGVRISAAAIGGGEGTQISSFRAPVAAPNQATGATAGADYQQEAKNSVAPGTTPVGTDDLFEYKLGKPTTIGRNESAVIPILQTTVDVAPVSMWLSREQNKGVERALWVSNSSGLVLDRGGFTIVENGTFAGQGEIPLLHPGERRLAGYGVDQAIKVDGREAKDIPSHVVRVEVANGVLSVHDRFVREHVYTIQNTGTTARTVVLGVPQSEFAMRLGKSMGPWELSKTTPAVETIGAGPKGLHYRFEVQVEANSTKTFTMQEFHTHPTKTPLEKMSADDLAKVIRDSHDNADVVAQLQPIVVAKKKIVELDAQMKEQQRAIDEANAEEARLRQNIVALKGSAEEKPMTKRYTDEMLAEEDKLAAIKTKRDAARDERATTQKTLAEQIQGLKLDMPIPVA